MMLLFSEESLEHSAMTVRFRAVLKGVQCGHCVTAEEKEQENLIQNRQLTLTDWGTETHFQFHAPFSSC